MGKIIGYGKLGRSMPLTLDKCGNLGGDVEMAAVVGELARRHPEDTFVLLGRNTGERPQDVGLPSNVVNPWVEWAPILRREINRVKAPGPTSLSVEEHVKVREVFRDLTEDAFIKCDGIVMWVGQHGTTNAAIPSIQSPGKLTKPYDWCAYYASFILQGINAWRDVDPWAREEIYLNADARNRHKMRDLKWPLRHPILTQYAFENNLKHERYGDNTLPPEKWWYHTRAQHEYIPGGPILWTSIVKNVYARLEVNGLRPGTPFGDLIAYSDDWTRPGHFGLFINEARAQGIRPETARVNVFRDWITPLDPYFVHGTWSPKSLATLGRQIEPAPWSEYYPRLHSVRCTFTTPSSGSGWATAKPWEAFAAGTVCFFHPEYDTQNNILSDADPTLQNWLRVKNVRELAARVDHLNTEAGRQDWEWLVQAQRAHFDKALEDLTYMKMIEERLYP